MRNRIISRLMHRLEFGVLITMSGVLCILPPSIVYFLARGVSLFAFHVIGIRRKVTMDNLRKALGSSRSTADLERLAREVYINIGMTFFEMLLLPRLVDRIPEVVEGSELPVLSRVCERGKGVILVSCHFSNWELTGASIGAAGFPVTVVAKRQSNPFADAWIHRYRERSKMKIINPGAPIKHILLALRRKELIGLISDQDAGSRGVFVDFFGQPASTPRGAAELALKYGVPVVVRMSIRTGPGKYHGIIREVEVLADDTVESLTQRYTTAMEGIIREHPEQYFWMHRRWKTRPAGFVPAHDSLTATELSGDTP